MLRGWANYYRDAWGAKKILNGLDHHVWWTIARWLKKKRRTLLLHLGSRYGWRKPGGRALRWRDGNPPLRNVQRARRAVQAGMDRQLIRVIDGEPGAQRKVHAGFERGRPENDPVQAGRVVVLVGLGDLEGRLRLGRSRSLYSRRLTLEPFTPDDTSAYLAVRLRRAGCDRELIPQDTVTRLHESHRWRPPRPRPHRRDLPSARRAQKRKLR
jgi:hypothetical protein